MLINCLPKAEDINSVLVYLKEYINKFSVCNDISI